MKNKNEEENKDVFGHKWRLAPGGKQKIESCQMRTWDLQTELNGFSAIIRNMGNCELDAGELYGISMTLGRMAKRLGKISDKLSSAIKEEER